MSRIFTESGSAVREKLAMSVQVGILNFDEEPVNKALLARIGGALYEYGPDGEQYYFDGSVGK